jgi:hypothetical protein
MEQILISQFTKFIPDCKELIGGKIMLDYINRTIDSEAEFIEKSCGCKKRAKDHRILDEQSETFFDLLSSKGSEDFTEIHAIEIVILPNKITPKIYGEKDGKKGFKSYSL